MPCPEIICNFLYCFPTGKLSTFSNSTSTHRPACPIKARLDITELEQNVQLYLQSAMPKSTVATYTSAHHRYLDFCHCSSHQPYPASEKTLCQFAGFLGQQNLKHQTIKSYLSGVQYFYIVQSFPDPFIRNMPRLQHLKMPSQACEQAAPNYPCYFMWCSQDTFSDPIRLQPYYAVGSCHIMLFRFPSIW